MQKKILLYAFSSWGKNNSNISELVLQKLSWSADKLTLQVRFDPQPFIDILAMDYSHIIGLGQYPRGKSIRLEQIAHNIYGSKSRGFESIDDGPENLQVDLEFKPTNHSKLAFDAGKFVCNYSMYTILKNKKQNQKHAFLHIPKGIELSKAVKYVDEILRQIV